MMERKSSVHDDATHGLKYVILNNQHLKRLEQLRCQDLVEIDRVEYDFICLTVVKFCCWSWTLFAF